MGGLQSMVRLLCCAGHATRGMLFAFAIYAKWRYPTNDADYFRLSTLHEQVR